MTESYSLKIVPDHTASEEIQAGSSCFLLKISALDRRRCHDNLESERGSERPNELFIAV